MGEEEVGCGCWLSSGVRGRMERDHEGRVPRICVGMYAYAWVVRDGDVGEKRKWVRVPRICVGMYTYAWVGNVARRSDRVDEQGVARICLGSMHMRGMPRRELRWLRHSGLDTPCLDGVGHSQKPAEKQFSHF
ncbi:hypothetical protein PIB30_098444 [Stylosanthes scabra]|uniref:Uncharacterized protein n=1 Tax=Stylosanthes scabra TaxID=79078 RepID=A0ABU6RWZ0_9FABA|nr:hypothetical protein [Stylosanthes scabra]